MITAALREFISSNPPPDADSTILVPKHDTDDEWKNAT